MRNISKYDILKSNNCARDTDLLLHPQVLASELAKIEQNCPIRIGMINGVNTDILMVNKAIESLRATGKMRYYLPKGMIIPIGGLDGKYYLRTLGTYQEKDFGYTTDYGYEVVEKSSNRVIYVGKDLSYLDQNVAALDKLVILKNTIVYHRGSMVTFTETGYVLLNNMEEKEINGEKYHEHVELLYDRESKVVATSFAMTHDNLLHLGLHAPKLVKEELPKDVALFEQMLIARLKDCPELQECDADSLTDIADWLSEHNLGLVIGLDSLEVYKVNYTRYFRRLEEGQTRIRKK